MDFRELISKMIEQLSKSDKYIMKAKYSDDREIAKLYHKMAKDSHDNYVLLHNLMEHKAKEYIGDTFTPEDKMYKIIHCIMDDWAIDAQERIEKIKIM